MKRYAEYRDSEIPWLGEIPSEWDINRGKEILTLLERSVLDDDEVITCFRDGEVTLRKNRREDGFTVSLKEVGYQGIEPGDLVVHGMDGFAGSIGVSDSRGKATPVLNVMDSKQNKRFLMYYLRMAAYRDVFMSLSTGIRVRSCDLRWNKLSVFPFLIPPIEEQNAIAEFIDINLSKVDALISEAKASIEEYKAWKASIIYEAVTKGLDKNVEMKDSGVEWIGEIPCNWQVVSFLTYIKSIVDYRGKTPDKQIEGTQLITAKNIKDGKIDYEISKEYVRTEEYEEIMHRGRVEIGDVLFTTEAPLGAVANADQSGFALAQRIIKFRGVEEKLDNYYLKYWIMSSGFQQNLYTFSTGSTAKGIKASKLGLLKQVLPPLEDQKKIVDYLDKICLSFEDIIKEKESLISDLESYKKSLIFETVTGKRKVV